MDIFDIVGQQINDAASSQGGNRLRPGKGRLLVKSMKLHKGFKGISFIADFEIVSSSKTHQTEEPNPVGSSFAEVYTMNGEHAALKAGNAKALLEVLGGRKIASGDEWKKVLRLAADESGPQVFRGFWLDYETYEKVSKKGNNMTLPTWKHVSEAEGNAPEKVAQRRAYVEGRSPVATFTQASA